MGSAVSLFPTRRLGVLRPEVLPGEERKSLSVKAIKEGDEVFSVSQQSQRPSKDFESIKGQEDIISEAESNYAPVPADQLASPRQHRLDLRETLKTLHISDQVVPSSFTRDAEQSLLLRAILEGEQEHESQGTESGTEISRSHRGNLHSVVNDMLREGETTQKTFLKNCFAELRRAMQINTLSRELSERRSLRSQFAYAVRTVCELAEADRAVLYLVDDEEEVLRLQMIRQRGVDATGEVEQVAVPIGEGVCGWVAEQGEAIIINDTSSHNLFSSDVDEMTNYTTKNMMSLSIGCAQREFQEEDGSASPNMTLQGGMSGKVDGFGDESTIPDQKKEVIGVIEVMNKRGGRKFTKQDLDLLSAAATVIAGFIAGTQMREREAKERHRKEAILEMAVSVSSAHDIHALLNTVVAKLEATFSASRCSLFFLDNQQREFWTLASSLDPDLRLDVAAATRDNIVRLPMTQGVLGHVAMTGQVLNLSDAQFDELVTSQWPSNDSGFVTRSVLCGPIKNHESNVIAVVMLVNKRSHGICNLDEYVSAFGSRTGSSSSYDLGGGSVASAEMGSQNCPDDEAPGEGHSPVPTLDVGSNTVSLRPTEFTRSSSQSSYNFNHSRSKRQARSKRNSSAGLGRARAGSVAYTADGDVAFDSDDSKLLQGMFSMLGVAISNMELISESFITQNRLKCVLENVSELVLTVDKDGFLIGCNRKVREINALFSAGAGPTVGEGEGKDKTVSVETMRTQRVSEWLPDKAIARDLEELLASANSTIEVARKRNSVLLMDSGLPKNSMQSKSPNEINFGALGFTVADHQLLDGEGHFVNYNIRPLVGTGTNFQSLANKQRSAAEDESMKYSSSKKQVLFKMLSPPEHVFDEMSGRSSSTNESSPRAPVPINKKSSAMQSSAMFADADEFYPHGEEDFAKEIADSSYAHKSVGKVAGKDSEFLGAVLCIDDRSPEQKLKKTLEKYISPDLVSHIMDGNGKLQLGGVRQRVTILFSDIRGFTTFSEKASAGEVFQTLNEYFSRMVTVIQDHGGIVDKFIGDALMAVFGVPDPGDPGQDARNACRAALAMQEELEVFNLDRKARGLDPINIGIGIGTGDVHCGNIGSENRFEYTVIGDSVNVASRLESSTKEYSLVNLVCCDTFESIRQSGAPIEVINELPEEDLVSEDLGKGGDVLFIREVDVVRVAGKDKTTRLFEVLGQGHALKTFVTPERLEALQDYSLGLKAYRAKNIPDAISHFERAADNGDGASLLFEERCDHLMEKGGWDKPSFNGIWDMRKVSVWSYKEDTVLQNEKMTRRASKRALTASNVPNAIGALSEAKVGGDVLSEQKSPEEAKTAESPKSPKRGRTKRSGSIIITENSRAHFPQQP